MNSDNFCYWLRGFTELRDNTVPPTAEQWLEIQRHLKLVFNRQDAPAPNLNTVPRHAVPGSLPPGFTTPIWGGLQNAAVPPLTC